MVYVGVYELQTLRLLGVFEVRKGVTELQDLGECIRKTYQGQVEIEFDYSTGLAANSRTGVQVYLGREAFMSALRASNRDADAIAMIMASLDSQFAAATGNHNEIQARREQMADVALNAFVESDAEQEPTMAISAAPTPDAEQQLEQKVREQFDHLMKIIQSRDVPITIKFFDGEEINIRSNEVCFIDELGRPPYPFMYPENITLLASEKAVKYLRINKEKEISINVEISQQGIDLMPNTNQMLSRIMANRRDGLPNG